MKVLLLVLFGLAFKASTANWGDKIEKTLIEKCNTNAQDENAFLEFQNANRNYYLCQFASNVPNPVEDHEGFCTTLRTSGFYTCIENLAKAAARCLDDTEKYLPEFVLHGINLTYVELCGPDGLANAKILYDMKRESHCAEQTDEVWNDSECFKTLTIAKNIDDGIINLNKKIVCGDLEALQKCIGDRAKKLCVPEYIQVVDLAFKPFTAECNKLEE